ncbi:hypothetical protein PC120_g3985 [Phytophthora cactorum]|nr:hypothetical protein PC120_g3985 [Phytophthora cactorum]
MSPTSSSSTSRQPSPAPGVIGIDVHALNVVVDPFEMFENGHSFSAVSEAHERASRTSDASSERLDRLEGLLEGMARRQAEIMVNQLKMQDQLVRRADATPTPPSERSFHGSSAFTDFIRARDRRMRTGSLDEPMHAVAPAVPPRTPPPQPMAQPPHQSPQSAQQFMPPADFGLKIPKPRDLDWPGFTRFSRKETYPGVGADFKSWGLRFLQRLGAAQQMSGGDCPEGFKLLALNGKLEGTTLNYYKKMLPMTPIPSTKGIEMMAAEKDRNKTWLEHYQFLVYVAERSGNTEQSVLECLCKSAPAYIQTAMLTRLNTQR